jgi:hypothetical protein
MALITTSNLSLKVIANTKNNTTYSITGIPVPQKFRVQGKQRSYGNTTVTDGHITKSYTTSASLSRTDAGTSNEVSTYTLSATMPLNKSLKIALISLTPSTGFSLLKKPSTVLRKPITGLSVYLEETTTANVYNLICNISREIKQFENVIIDLNYLIEKSPAILSGDVIKKVHVGSLNIPPYGSNKVIKIHGTPNAPFELSVLDNNDKSIITTANNTGVTPSGVVDTFSSTLNKRGYFSFRQQLPSAPIVLVTAVNVGGGVSSATQVTFDSLSGVLAGDEIMITDSRGNLINNGEPIRVISIDSTYVCTLSKRVTLADNKKVKFRRAASYKINIETTGTKDSKLNNTYPTYTITQNLSKMVTFNATTSNGSIAINGGSGGATYSSSICGKYSYKGSIYTVLTYTLTGKTFTEQSNHPALSDFVIASGDANISGTVTGSGSGTTTYTIKAILSLELGEEDTVFNINLDNIVT